MGTESKLPDFEDLFQMSEKIRELSYQKLYLEHLIKSGEAGVILEATSNPDYHVGGKTPSISYLKDSLCYTGLQGELLEKRQELAGVTADLEQAKEHLRILHDLVDVWRTEQANLRSAVV